MRDMTTKPTSMLAGLRGTYWNDAHGTWVSVYDGSITGVDTDGGRWQVVCEAHGSILSVDTLKQAHEDARGDSADFCEECREQTPEQDYSKLHAATAHILRTGLKLHSDLPQYGWRLRCEGEYSDGVPFWQYDHHTKRYGDWVLTAHCGSNGLEYESNRAMWRSGETI